MARYCQMSNSNKDQIRKASHDTPLKSHWTFENWITAAIFQWNVCVHVSSHSPLSKLRSDNVSQKHPLHFAYIRSFQAFTTQEKYIVDVLTLFQNVEQGESLLLIQWCKDVSQKHF